MSEASILKNVKLRVTPSRLAVLSFLNKANKPIDISEIIDWLNKFRIPTNKATVFRIMNTFTKKGITIQVQFQEGKKRYELKSRGDHHHLICENCGRVQDVFDCVIPALEKKIAKSNNFIIKKHSLEFFGLCRNCL